MNTPPKDNDFSSFLAVSIFRSVFLLLLRKPSKGVSQGHLRVLAGTSPTMQTIGRARHGGDGDGVHADDTNE